MTIIFKVLTLFIALTFFWWVLSGILEPFFIIAALASVVITLVIIDRMLLIDNTKPLYVRPKLFFYLIWLLKEIVKSGIGVTIRIWQLEPAIRPTLSWISSSQKSDVPLVLYANSITLTPGTVCVNTDGKNLQVHSLYLDTIESLKSGQMNYKVSEVT